MQLIQFTELGGPSVLVVNSVPIPTSSFPSILIKNSFIGINYIDTYHRSGLYPVTLPYTPGREASGVIQSSTIPDFSPGDRVAYLSTNTYSEYSLLTTSDFIVKLPDSVSLQVGACLLLQGLTAMMLTHLAFKVTSKSVVLVHAANGGTFI